MSVHQDAFPFYGSVPGRLAKTFGSVELGKRLAITARQLQWWDEQGLLPAGHEGYKRVYTKREALLAGVIAKLRKTGLGRKRLKNALRPMTSRHRDESLGRYLVVNWRSGWSDMAASESQALGIAAALSSQGVPCLLIDLEQIERRLQ
jgi:DNA-binding transcriptional MerR regulator